MYYVYILRSINYPSQLYYGFTTDLRRRVKEHNKGRSYHTSKYKPWKLLFYSAFENRELAEDFEKYLKTASGRAFLRKRFIKTE